MVQNEAPKSLSTSCTKTIIHRFVPAMQGKSGITFPLCNVTDQSCEKDCFNTKIVLPQKVITKSPLFHKLLPKHHHFLIVADNESCQKTPKNKNLPKKKKKKLSSYLSSLQIRKAANITSGVL